MEIKKGNSFPRKGMQLSSHPSEVLREEYSFALNANIHNENGDGPVLLQNESSNIKCSNFRDGYFVIGHKFDVNSDRTYFFLTNPTTGNSEIGYIDSIRDPYSLEATEAQCGCDIKVVLESPLENTEQQGYCTYHTMLSDECEEFPGSKCLNFDVNYPIHESNVQIKDEVIGRRMYFTDGNNPPRYIKIDDLEEYFLEDSGCGETEDSCLDCEKMRIFPLYDKPCLFPTVIQSGGNLLSGIYEIAIAYCTNEGEEVSNYFGFTNPIHLFDLNNTYLDQADLYYNTGFSVQLDVSDLDDRFDYYKIVVAHRTALDQSTVYKTVGVNTVSNDRVILSTLEGLDNITLEEIYTRRPYFEKARGMASGNGYLFQFGLEAQREVNLQPVVSLMGGFVKWNTAISTEDIYKDGVNASNYVGYMRDEVVPLSIKFFMRGGQETSNFLFVPRPPTESELEEYVDQQGNIVGTNQNVSSILENDPSCVKAGRRYKWQFENTATVDEGNCPVAGDLGENVVNKVEEFNCLVLGQDELPQTVDTIVGPEELSITSGVDIVNYINNNIENIKNSENPFDDTSWDGIRAILSDSYLAFICEPDKPEFCSALTLDSFEIFAIEVGSQEVEQELFAYEDYDRVKIPEQCRRVSTDENGDPIRDSAFESAYMEVGEQVFKKESVLNGSCVNAVNVADYNDLSPATGVYLTDRGSVGSDASLLTDKNAESSGTEFKNKLHTNAIWFKKDFGSEDKLLIELSTLSACINPDDNTGDKLRVTFYDSCSTVNHVVSYSRVITDLMAVNDTDKFFELDKADFPSGSVFMAIDSEMTQQTISGDEVYRLAPPCGCLSVYNRPLQYKSKVVFTNLEFGKRMKYTAECTYTQPDASDVNGCEPFPWKTGKFSYWESELKYPCNRELWDSSVLSVSPSDIPEGIKSDFEEYYTDGVDADGNYILKDTTTDLTDKPIKHYKFPDNKIAPFMSGIENKPDDFSDSFVFPIGFTIDNEVIRKFLDVAVKNNLITPVERSKINRYEIFRGDRRTDKSIVAKGVLFDVYKYNEINSNVSNAPVRYSNYPLNTLGTDQFNLVPHPHNSNGNNEFTFHSPDTHFYNPTLPTELIVDGYLFGKSYNVFNEVRNHPRNVVLGQRAIVLAFTLASIEVAFEAFLQSYDWFIEANSGHISTAFSANVIAVTGVTALLTSSLFQIGPKAQQWIDIFRGIGKPEQFAYYQASIGHYSYFTANNVDNSFYRALPIRSYVRDGRLNLSTPLGSTDVLLNNQDREDAVFLSTGDFNVNYPSDYRSYDNINLNPINATRHSYEGIGGSGAFKKNTAVPYTALKRYLPTQYGNVNSITWISTNYCGKLTDNNVCDTIFGGDTFISRFSLKRKLPFFRSTAFGLANNTPFRYSDYFNINPPDPTILTPPSNRFYLNYKVNSADTFGGILFPTDRSEYNFDNPSTSNVFYERPPSKFYLYSYGFPYFLVESEFNCNTRYAGKDVGQDFYPNNRDIEALTQESSVPIRTPENFFFNDVYRNIGTRSPWWTLPDTYERKIYDRINNLRNSLIYSRIDSSETDISDPWLNYRPFDFYNFSSSFGRLFDMSLIESEQILARFKNGFSIFGAVDTLADRITPETFKAGQGGIFAGRIVNFNKTQLGYAGTQHVVKVSCNFGHFWADAKRGQVFMLSPNASEGAKEISIPNDKWFKQNLPFKIQSVDGITDEDVDNNYKGIGLSMGWDERLKRVFLTKLDYLPKNDNIQYIDRDFYIEGEQGLTLIDVKDEEYFEDCSWTIAYSPIVGNWISFYSFKPNFYIGYNDYFQTAIREGGGTSLWSHLPFVSSHQVFYGNLYPFKIEYPITSQGVNSVLHSVDYSLDTKKYYNKFDQADIFGAGFNKAVIYNNYQNSGLLELRHQDKNDLAQSLEYPRSNSESTEILQSEINGKWTFNSFYNLVRNERSGLPLWIHDLQNVDKDINHKLLDYSPAYRDRLRGENFFVRLIQDKESRYKMVFRLANDKREFYE